MISLDRPGSAEDLYLARGDEVRPFRPVLTGDVFAEIAIPGLDGHELGMVISHPCNMREGAALKEKIQMLPIRPYQEITLEAWTTGGHARVFCLPESRLMDGPCAARFDETGMVASADLTPVRRRMCLSEKGILLLLQRMVFGQSRADIPLQKFDAVVGHVLAEADLLEEWNERLIPDDLNEEEMIAALATQADAFDTFLSTVIDGSTLRADLQDAYSRPAVRRAIRAEIGRLL